LLLWVCRKKKQKTRDYDSKFSMEIYLDGHRLGE
jgi:hypothetical protein